MNMHEMAPTGNLTPQDLQHYFNWPPPPTPRNRKRLLVRLFAIYIVVVILILLFLYFTSHQHLSSPNTSYVIAFLLITFALFAFAFGPLLYRLLKHILTTPRYIPTDQQYEDWIRSWKNSLRQYGLERLNLRPEEVIGKPLYVRSIVWPDSTEARMYQHQQTPLLIKYGADRRAHGSVNRYTFFYPTQHAIAVFIGDISALGNARFEGTRTYFYDDIVGVETSAINLYADVSMYVMQRFELRVSSGQSIGATTHVHDLDVDQTVQALRTLLRDKKYGTRGGGFGSTGYVY